MPPPPHTHTHPTGADARYPELPQCAVVRELMEDFRQVTGLPVHFLPANDGDHVSAPKFCVAQRRNPRHGPACRVLKKLLARVAQTRQIERVFCRSGLTQVAVPVLVDDRHVGTLVGGPVTARRGLDRQLRLLAMQAHLLGAAAGRLVLEGNGNEPVAVRQCKEYIAQHLAAHLTVPLLARRVNLSPHHLSRVFKQATGLTVIVYLQRARIERAKDLLADARLPVKTVADQTGFPSLPYFTRTFHRLTGQTPSHYRRALLAARKATTNYTK